MTRRRRLDAELVRRKEARSRGAAVAMIKAGRVEVAGFRASKPATQVDEGVSIRVRPVVAREWASRGAHKLVGALDKLELDASGLRILDAGASTGGFTDVLLDRGAREVVAVDVGYGQLIQRIATDRRVRVYDRTNVRHLDPEAIGGRVDAAVGDLSFISLRLVLPALARCVRPGGWLLPMVKPQFEVGKDRIGHGGVVRSPQLRAETVRAVVDAALDLGLSCTGVTASPLPGPNGNVEYFLRLVSDGGAAAPTGQDTESMIAIAIEEGPR